MAKQNGLRAAVHSLILMLGIALMVQSAHPVLVRFTLGQMTEGAEAIVHGRVRAVRCEWSQDHTLITTVATLEITDILKGRLSSAIVYVQYPGGQIDELGLRVSDMPSLNQGEDVLLFLKRIPEPQNLKNSWSVAKNLLPGFEVFAFAQGKYHVDEQNLAHPEKYHVYPAGGEVPQPVPLQELKNRIRNILSESPVRLKKTDDKIKR